MSSKGLKIDGAEAHRAAVTRAAELGSDAVAHARAVADALNLPEAPVSPDAPPPCEAPPYPAPPYPPRAAAPAAAKQDEAQPDPPAPQGDPSQEAP